MQPAWSMRRAQARAAAVQAETSSSQVWTGLGPKAISTSQYGLVSGRVTALALDPNDTTGNTLYVGTTGGGVWKSQNAATATSSKISFTPLTDDLTALNYQPDASISIGALAVQPGGTGVVLAGTGDPNDALDSYYGGGILRSADNGATWSLIKSTSNLKYWFLGEGFAGFAWSTTSSNTVVAAVSQAWGGYLADATLSGYSSQGLYYSTDAGKMWTLATIKDGSTVIQGQGAIFAGPDGNAATAVVWNPVRKVFIAAVRYHGYYSSSDGITWTRLSTQPGAKLTTANCPSNAGATGSPACPIFRGALAVNSTTGDTFAWAVDSSNQDQGLYQDVCSASSGACSTTIAWGTQWPTSNLEISDSLGSSTIENGDYNLTLAVVPQDQDTMIVAGANDLWQCSLAMSCAWRNTTNSASCMTAKVGEYQHAIEWNPSNTDEILVGNDSGLWRSMDGIAETGTACAATDASHFDNLNGQLGSLSEVESMVGVDATPYTLLAGMGANGAAGVKATAAVTDWPQVLTGEGGPVAIDQTVSPAKWYVNNAAGVSIHACTSSSACTATLFGSTAAVDDTDVNGDGDAMTTPAPFVVDALDHTKLLVGTCRVWRGPATGSWTTSNALSPLLDGMSNSACDGDPLVRTLAAMKTADGGEMIYAGMYGLNNSGGVLPGHVFRAKMTAKGVASTWTDLYANAVSGSSYAFNAGESDISGIYIDPHDITGMTVYVTVEGLNNQSSGAGMLYRSTDGGASWQMVAANLPASPANTVVVDPGDANTVYVGLDAGVFSTQAIGDCLTASCWSELGSGLPTSPVTSLRAAPVDSTYPVLVAGTYGRGVWMTPLLSVGTVTTTATAKPTSLSFSSQAVNTTSSAKTVTVTNTGANSLKVTGVSATGDFDESDTCNGETVAAGASCTVSVTFSPMSTGTRSGTLTITGNISSGNLTVALSGTATAAPTVTVAPASIAFQTVQVKKTSKNCPTTVTGSTTGVCQVTVTNTGSNAVTLSGFSIDNSVFAIASNSCASLTTLAKSSACNLLLSFTPTTAATVTGTLTVTDSVGKQTVALSGTGLAAATDTLKPASLTFTKTATGVKSDPQTVTLTNTGGVALTSITVKLESGKALSSQPFQVTNNCGTQLAANSSCTIQVIFAPAAAGTLSDTLLIGDISRSTAQQVPLSGTAILNGILTPSPTSLSFTGQTVGKSATKTLTITNTGGLTLSDVGFQITGTSEAMFSLTSIGCETKLAAGKSCTVGVAFTPTAAGGASATLAISSSTAGVSAVAVPLAGTSSSMTGLNVSPNSLQFPIEKPGSVSGAQRVVVSNAGTTAATGLSFKASSPFVAVNNACGTSLPAGSSCTVGVAFKPQVAGSFSGQLTISSTSSTSATVLLSGVGGTPGQLTASPETLSFSQTGVGLVSDPQKVTLTNPSLTTALTGLTLTASEEFNLKSTTCGTTLAVGKSCQAVVTFSPTAAGTQTGTLTVGSSTLNEGIQVALTGLGFDFTVTPSGSSSASVVSGGTANYTLAITPGNKSYGVFSYTCSGLPSYSACVFNPTTETISAGATGTALIEIETGLTTTTSSVRLHTAQAKRGGWPGWPLAPLICGVVLAPWSSKKRRRGLLLMGLLALALAAGNGCTVSGGNLSGGTKGGAGVTPSGDYTITVTVSSNGVSHAQSLTLTVE